MRDMSTGPGPRTGERGLTLIEIIISLSLFLLVVLPVALLLVGSRQTTTESRIYATARLAVEHQLERLRSIASVEPSSVAGVADFENLAALLTARPTFAVQGIPAWEGHADQGIIYVCLDETKQYFADDLAALPHDDYFDRDGWRAVPYPAFGMNLDASFAAGVPTLTALGTGANYRVLPVRVEVFWGTSAMDAGWDLPKIAVNAVIAPKTRFRRG